MAVYDEGSKASGLDLRALCFSGSAEELMQTEVQQPTLVATSLAINAALRARGINPDFVVGHSVGEFSALGAAGSIGVGEAIALVRERGLAMAAAAKERPGSMAAILGLADEVVEGLCRKIANVWPANYNCPGQLVISGETDAVDEACSEAQHEGARRAIRLQGLGRVPLAVRRERRRAPAARDRQDRLQGADRAVRLDRDREARGRRPLPLAARRAADGAGASSRRPRASSSATASRRSSRSGPATC